MVRAYRHHTPEEDELCYSTRYLGALAKIRVLKETLKQIQLLNSSGIGIRVQTSGDTCLPASGNMLWIGGGFTCVWFDGCDQPVVWPMADLEVSNARVKCRDCC